MTLILDEVSVHYGALLAVDQVSLTVATGEVVALLGGSGSGKSSLLRAVAGLEPLSGGTVSIDGVSLAGIPVHRRGVGLMFQDGQLFGHLSVGENVGYGLVWRFNTKAERRARVAELLELVGLPGFEQRRVSELSGGQAQRVALARALAPEPQVLLLDEPLSALDRELREHLVGELRTILATTKTTSLYVTHDQDEAFAVADRVAILGDGRLLQLAAPEVLWRYPASRAVAEFLGYGPFVTPGLLAGGPVSFLADFAGPLLVGIGPQGLVLVADGVSVPVVAQRAGRGFISYTVVLPDGQAAELRVTAGDTPENSDSLPDSLVGRSFSSSVELVETTDPDREPRLTSTPRPTSLTVALDPSHCVLIEDVP